MSELRLYKLVEADRNQFLGVNRRVSVHEIVVDDELGNTTTFVMSRDLYGPHSGWETFDVTDAVRRWVKTELPWQSQILEIRIDTVDGEHDNVDVDFDTRQHIENEPILVVFSNDKKKRKAETRELHEMITHELEQYGLLEEDPSENEIDEDYDDYDYEYDLMGHDFAPKFAHDYDIRKRDTGSVERSGSKHLSKRSTRMLSRSKLMNNHNQTQLENLYKSILRIRQDDLADNKGGLSFDELLHREKRSKSKKKRRRGRRRFCRRKPMYVNFQDINWHTWIIAPRGYQVSVYD